MDAEGNSVWTTRPDSGTRTLVMASVCCHTQTITSGYGRSEMLSLDANDRPRIVLSLYLNRCNSQASECKIATVLYDNRLRCVHADMALELRKD